MKKQTQKGKKEKTLNSLKIVRGLKVKMVNVENAKKPISDLEVLKAKLTKIGTQENLNTKPQKSRWNLNELSNMFLDSIKKMKGKENLKISNATEIIKVLYNGKQPQKKQRVLKEGFAYLFMEISKHTDKPKSFFQDFVGLNGDVVFLRLKDFE